MAKKKKRSILYEYLLKSFRSIVILFLLSIVISLLNLISPELKKYLSIGHYFIKMHV